MVAMVELRGMLAMGELRGMVAMVRGMVAMVELRGMVAMVELRGMVAMVRGVVAMVEAQQRRNWSIPAATVPTQSHTTSLISLSITYSILYFIIAESAVQIYMPIRGSIIEEE
jgi:uncharacterized membrane protein HdeD (DUF308 family)